MTPLTRSKPECRRVLARLRLRRMELKRAGKYTLTGARYTSAAHTDVQRTWRANGWRPVKREAA